MISEGISDDIIHYTCEDRIEKSVPRDQRLSSLGKPLDAKRRSSGRIFLSWLGSFVIFENPSLGISVCHHSASLLMPNGDPRDGFFYPTNTLMIYTYNMSPASRRCWQIYEISTKNCVCWSNQNHEKVS